MNEAQITTLSSVKTTVELLLSNHIPHLQDQINSLDAKVWGIVAILLLGFTIQIYLSVRKK